MQDYVTALWFYFVCCKGSLIFWCYLNRFIFTPKFTIVYGVGHDGVWWLRVVFAVVVHASMVDDGPLQYLQWRAHFLYEGSDDACHLWPFLSEHCISWSRRFADYWKSHGEGMGEGISWSSPIFRTFVWNMIFKILLYHQHFIAVFIILIIIFFLSRTWSFSRILVWPVISDTLCSGHLWF